MTHKYRHYAKNEFICLFIYLFCSQFSDPLVGQYVKFLEDGIEKAKQMQGNVLP